MSAHFLATRVAVFFLLWPAQLARAEPSSGSSVIALSGDMGLGGLDGKVYSTIQTGLDIREGYLTLGLFGRVRLPLQEAQAAGYVHRRDWDETSDYVHILRYVHYSHLFGEISLNVKEGELLSYSLGHGTLIRDYCNVADPDHPHSGVNLRLSNRRLGFEAMVDNFLNPSIVAGRFDLRPIRSVPAWTIGASVVVDPRAPLTVRQDTTGQRLIDDAYNLQVESTPLTLIGVDAEYAFGDRARGKVTPYLDLNTSLYGFGMHLGAQGELPLGQTRARLGAQVEYRVSTASYSPAYMETFYDVDRYQASLSVHDPALTTEGQRAPKLAALEDGHFGGQGILAQLGFELQRLLQVRVGFSHRPGPDANTLWTRAATSPLEHLDLGVLFVARGLGEAGWGENGIMAMAEGRYRLTTHFYALGQYSRAWSLDENTRYFGTLQVFSLNLGTNWSG